MIWVGDRDLGSIVPEDEALVSVRDQGFTLGLGVYETLKVVDGTPFALTRHLRRLDASAARVGLPGPNPQVLRSAVADVLYANAPLLGSLARLRITCTAGDGVPSLVVTAQTMEPFAPTASIVTVPWVRNERSPIAGIKCTSSAEGMVAFSHARERGADEGVLANTRGELCEGTRTNVVVVVDGQALTPSLASGCLPGITRELLLEWCDVREATLPYDVLLAAEEVFLTSATRDVQSVTRIDDRRLEVGPVTESLRSTFTARAAQVIDP